jgi:predicted GIY-YIG superfamily endonuclease
MSKIANDKKYFCYILKTDHRPHRNRTYNGYTVNPKRRIRQHNQELVGGAKYTKSFGNKKWEMYVLVGGFKDSKNALQCEWRIKHPDNKRRRSAKYYGPIGRIKGLNEVLKLDKWTNNSIIDNKDQKFVVWIKKGFENYLTDLPNNFIVHIVDKINFDALTAPKIQTKVPLIEEKQLIILDVDAGLDVEIEETTNSLTDEEPITTLV